MKRVKLNQIHPGNRRSIYTEAKKNTVALGNETVKTFRNAKQATRYIADVNRKLNYILDDLNFLLIEVYRDSRIYWRAFSMSDAAIIAEYFHDVDKFFTRAIERSTTPNGNHFTFSYILQGSEAMSAIIQKIAYYAAKVNNYHGKRLIESYNERLQAIKIELQNIGKD